MEHLSKKKLVYLYVTKKQSVSQIAKTFDCSLHKVDYWLQRYSVPKRSIGEAMYAKRNPNGDPFFVKKPTTIAEATLQGLGFGLYWGEGTKSDRNSVRLGNTDVRLIKKFIQFLVQLYGVDKKRLKFGLQIFNDVSPQKARQFWCSKLRIMPKQFQKVVISKVRGNGSYKHKSQHGVLTVYFNNTKLRNIIFGEIERL